MKACEHCGSPFAKPPKLSAAQWVIRRFCSMVCSRTAQAVVDRPCAATGCLNRARNSTNEFCNLHRQRVRKHGDPNHERWPDKLARVMRRIRNDGCWQWTGSLLNSGYGQVWADGTNRLAHRVVYELLVGPIPTGLELDHLCRNRSCVNPTHLEPVTTRENLRRMRVALKGV